MCLSHAQPTRSSIFYLIAVYINAILRRSIDRWMDGCKRKYQPTQTRRMKRRYDIYKIYVCFINKQRRHRLSQIQHTLSFVLFAWTKTASIMNHHRANQKSTHTTTSFMYACMLYATLCRGTGASLPLSS